MEEYIKQARGHLDLLREKQPQNPEVFQAWANYYAAQNNLAPLCWRCRKPSPPIPTVRNRIWTLQRFSSAQTC